MWPYEVIDNYLDDETFNKLNNEIKDVIPEDGKIYRKWLDYDPTPQIETLVKNYMILYKTDFVNRLTRTTRSCIMKI